MSSTIIAAIITIIFAYPVAWFLEVPLPHIIVSFAPGGLETMIAIGAVIGVNPGFLAACHVGRLLILTFLVPIMIKLEKSR